MKKIVLIICFIFLGITVYSQQLENDTLLLNNGGVIVGRIIKSVENESIKIETASGDYFFVWNDIANIRIHTYENHHSNIDLQILNTSKSINTKDSVLLRNQIDELQNHSDISKIKTNDLPFSIFQMKVGIGTEHLNYSAIYS